MDYEAKSQPETLNAAIAAVDGLTYKAVFVPFSQSRNAKGAKKPSDYSLNWQVTLSKGGRSLTTDYSAGIAHIPGYKQTWDGKMTVDEFDAIKSACERGTTSFSPDGKPTHFCTGIPAPKLCDVIYSLVSDADALDAGSFEDWASDYGYDTDSRAAEKTYQACMDIALKLRAMLGDATVAALREACQDY